MNIDIVALVRDSMEKMGCGNAISGELDVHSPICIGFQSVPAMYVEHQDNKVLLWSELEFKGANHLGRSAEDLLTYLLPRGSDVFCCRRPVLSIVDDMLLLVGRVEEDYLRDADAFMQAMEVFYEDLCAVSEILDR